jgi:hypothetical protein
VSSYPIPQIIFDPGTGPITLTFTYPPVQKPYLDERHAVRHDSMSSSGIRQSTTERVDIVKVLNMESLPWVDLPAWGAFIDYAIQGGSFQFYPDATLPNFQTWELMDDHVAPRFAFISMSKVTMQFRLVPGGTSYP